jgi:hypothetical protein
MWDTNVNDKFDGITMNCVQHKGMKNCHRRSYRNFCSSSDAAADLSYSVFTQVQDKYFFLKNWGCLIIHKKVTMCYIGIFPENW